VERSGAAKVNAGGRGRRTQGEDCRLLNIVAIALVKTLTLPLVETRVSCEN